MYHYSEGLLERMKGETNNSEKEPPGLGFFILFWLFIVIPTLIALSPNCKTAIFYGIYLRCLVTRCSRSASMKPKQSVGGGFRLGWFT